MIDKTKVKIALAELLREKQVREKYYPNAVLERKLSKQEAERRLQALNYAIEVLQTLLSNGGEESAVHQASATGS